MIIRLSLRSRLRSSIAITSIAALIMSSGLPAMAQTYSTAPVPAAAPQGDPSQQQGTWPRELTAGNLRILMYQPQIDAWDGHILQSKAALAVGAGADTQSYGIAYFTARTEVDKNARQVFLHDVEIARVDMPGNRPLAAPVGDALRRQWAGQTRIISLDRLQASLAASQSWKNQTVEVDNTPPNILFTTTPAVLVLIDGAPVLQPVVDTHYERVVNTNALILKNSTTGRFDLRVAGLWATAPGLQGPWNIERAGLSEMDRIKAAALAKGHVDILDDDDQPGPYGVLPAIYISGVPAELLQADGEPQYAPIEGTRLLYVTNTVSDIFVDTSSQEFYVLISGRWYRARGVDGPWAYVDSAQLPGDFRRIPEQHPKGDVLASIAGTPQAEEAAIANTIPQTATIDRQAAQFQPVYDGAPQFQPVAGTPLYYAVNSPMPILRVDPNSYYAVYDGVWFTGPSPMGPWIVVEVVPPVIYTIPVSSPIYYCTYVRVYGYDPRYVYVGYTPGYFGTYVTRYGTVVYGSGYRYQPWVAQAYYPRPATYGFGAAFISGGFAGFALGLATAAIIASPAWGPYWGWHRDGVRRDFDGRDQRRFSSNVYAEPGNRAVVRTAAPASTGRAQAAAPSASPSTTGRAQPATAAAPQSATAAAPQTSTRERERERRVEEMRGSSQTYRDAAARNRAGTTASPGTAAPAGAAASADRNDVFVGADGKVYRRGDQGWERNERDRWAPTETRRTAAPATAPSAAKPAPAPGAASQGVGPSATGATGLNRADEAAGQRGAQGRDNAREQQERAAQEKAARDKAALDKAAQDKAAQDKAAQDKAAQDKAAQNKAAADKAAAERAQAARAAAEKSQQDQANQQRAAQERANQERANQERQRRDAAAAGVQQKQQQDQANQQRAAQERANQERANQERANQERQRRDAAAAAQQQQQQQQRQQAAKPQPQQPQRPQPAPPSSDEVRKKLEQERAARGAGAAQENANQNRAPTDAFTPPDRPGKRGPQQGG